MRMVAAYAFLFAFLAFLAVGTVAAEDAVPDRPRFRVLLRLDAPSEAEGGSYSDALATTLSRSPQVGEVLISSSSDLFAEAGIRACDVVVEAGLSTVADGLLQSWRIFGASSGEEIGAGSRESGRPDARSLSDDFWLDILSSLESALASIDARSAVRFLVTGPPGARVTGLGPEPLVLPEGGSAELRLRAPATYSWRASARDYYSSRGVAALVGQEPASLDLAMERQRRWTLDTGLYNAAFADYWASYRFLDDRFFVRAGMRQYLLGLSLLDAEPGFDPPCIVSLPLVQLGVGGGTILGEPGRRLRIYLGALATTRLAFPPGGGVFVDPIAPLCLEPFCGVEWKPKAKFGFFGEMYAGLYVPADELLFAATIGESDGPSPLYLFGDGWVFNVPNLRFGARLFL